MKLALHWKWFFGLLTLIAGLLLAASIGIGMALPPFLERTIRKDLERNAVLAREAFLSQLAFSAGDRTAVNALAHKLAERTGLRVTIMAADGVVIGESDKPPDQLQTIENHLNRPEVQEAIRMGAGATKRHSATIGVDLLYVAVSARDNERLHGIVRVALPLHQIADITAHVRGVIAAVGAGVGLAAVPFLFWMARRVTRPIRQMSEAAGQIALGQFPQTIRVDAKGELAELAAALNDMSDQLQARLRELAEEKAELAAVLASMAEGVLVADANGRVRMMNASFRQQFTVGDEFLGKTVLETVRNVELQELIALAVREGNVTGREIETLHPTEQTFGVNAVCLRGRDGARRGAVVVFHDMTRIRQLENVRKEFVANVSHELRTPLSIIKGYIETLLDEQPVGEQNAKQFLQTIGKHSRQLEALIEDLLTISVLESQPARLDLSPVSLRSVALAVIEELSARARAGSISIVLEIGEQTPPVRADARRLRQVILNLLDNAVKYTQPGGRVTVCAKERGEEMEVCVADNGPGIAAEHLPRVFERFYRVDKARSRELGGTGLGLAIVKHIVQAHGGRVWAESAEGKGSRFFFTLPRC